MGRHTKLKYTGRLFKPTDEQRRQVLTMTGFGIRQDEIATSLEISKNTLHKHFRRELDTGMTEANVRVAQALYTNAVKNMNIAAQIWWTKTRMGWKEAVDPNATLPVSISFRWADATPGIPAPDDRAASAPGVQWIDGEATEVAGD